MNRKELYMQVEELHDVFEEFENVEVTEDDIRAMEEVMNLLKLGLKVYTTDELVLELLKTKGVLIIDKTNDLDDGAVG